MSESQFSFEWRPTALERLSRSEFLMRRPLYRWLARIAGVYLLLMAIMMAGTALVSKSETHITDWLWCAFFVGWAAAFLIRPAVVFPSVDSIQMMSRRLTVDESGIIVQNLGLRLYPHRIHWSRLGPLETFGDGYGLSVDDGYSAVWIPRRVLGDREREFCEFVKAQRGMKDRDPVRKSALTQ